MVTKNQIKRVKSLQQKKYRNLYGQFAVEGVKTVSELLNADFELVDVYCVSKQAFNFHNVSTLIISDGALQKMSSLRSPNGVLAVFKIPKIKPLDTKDWVLVLDTVQDPGNLGTIIRLCDWFGIRHLVCSHETVDLYNPKVLQATMGSIARVNVVYCDVQGYLRDTSLPVYGAYMKGNSVYESKLPEKGILIMGNEANGISDVLKRFVKEKIAIPQYGQQSAESLNVATATAILLHEIRRI
ncbi:MAG: RNA methyltransferase [Bacteroidota bacterium]